MTMQEYEAKFSEDDAPGWDAIAGALEKIYDPANERHYASWLHASLSGEDYLEGVSIFNSIEGMPHRHLVSFGMSELYYDLQSSQDEFSGWEFEFSMRIVPFADDPDSKSGDDTVVPHEPFFGRDLSCKISPNTSTTAKNGSRLIILYRPTLLCALIPILN